MESNSSSDIGAFLSLISASYRQDWICSGVMAAKFGVRPMGVAMFAMPGVPIGVAPGVNMPMPGASGVAPGVAEGVLSLPDMPSEWGVESVGVASTPPPGVAPGSSMGVSSQRARFRLPPPATGVSPHCPGVGVSPISSSLSLSPASAQEPFFILPSSSKSVPPGVSPGSAPPTGVAQRSPSSSLPSVFSFLPALASHRLFFFSAVGASPPSFLASISSSFCF
mmetsp:Transcript_60307/g.153216  ORF Transcript_60307/g.153216 Transcript_60307/m.153216 type:complete len:223 (+) Transcript_60307:2988-3656(+)